MGIISRITSAIGSLVSGVVGAIKAIIPGV